MTKEDLKEQMETHFLQYASYVIRDRAIPHVLDGLKPVQRRILFTLRQQNDDKLHKVANIVGQTMIYHPHGDAPIYEALVNVAMKGYLLDRQGNFGNLYTGDPASAARYIETRLSPLARETLFNPDLTEMLPSYDGRHQEPKTLPCKIPLLLMQGAEGIAVGMSTRILPHNFVELLEAQIALLNGEEVDLVPDFPTGGIMDASQYEKGRGKVKLRAKIEIKDPKTILIKQICYGTTTESLIRSIDEAAKKGKVKIDSISDYTAEKVEIEIKLPRGQYAKDVIKALYAYTDCEVSLNSQIVVIQKDMPWETDVVEILRVQTQALQGYLQRELEIDQARHLEKIFQKTLEQIFIENRLYKKIEELKTYEEIHKTIEKSLIPFHLQLIRVPTEEDREKLLNIPIRRITRFDIDKNQREIAEIEKNLKQIEKNLKNVKKYTIGYIENLLKKYGDEHPRLTQIDEIQEVDKRAIERCEITVGYDAASGFLGTKVKTGEQISCTNFDKLLILFQDGTYTVINIPEKQYHHETGKKVAHIGVSDKKTTFNVVYKNPKTNQCFAKRFVVSKYILDKEYRYIEEGMKLEMLSTAPTVQLQVNFVPSVRQKVTKMDFDMGEVLVKGVSAKGVRLSSKPIKKIKVVNG
ncbi:MAG: DNA topoisomerase IV subunit A [Chlamydiia bacterium]|nr:DNA topoisomerase IV subunit A [Chlamydiia bacterium]